MLDTETTIARVRLRAGASSGAERARSTGGYWSRQRLATLLAAVDFRPPGMPPAAVLVIRSLQDPQPQGMFCDRQGLLVSQRWQAELRSLLADALRAARRPALQPVAADASAVLFADRAELLACYVSDLLAEKAEQCWWWAHLVPARLGRASEWSVVALRSPEHVPAALALLDERALLAPALALLSSHAVSALAFALEQALEPTPAARALQRLVGSEQGSLLLSERCLEALGSRSARALSDLAPDRRRFALLALCLVAPAHAQRDARAVLEGAVGAGHANTRATDAWMPASVPTHVPQRPAQVLSTRPTSASGPTRGSQLGTSSTGGVPSEPPASSGASMTAPAASHPVARSQAGTAENAARMAKDGQAPLSEHELSVHAQAYRGPRADASTPVTQAPHEPLADANSGESRARPMQPPERASDERASSIAAVGEAAAALPTDALAASAAMSDATVLASPIADTGPTEADTAPASEAAYRVTGGVRTALAGSYYLLVLLLEPEWLECFEETWQLAERAGIWETLELLLIGAAGELDDPLWEVLRALSGRPHGEPPGSRLALNANAAPAPVATPPRLLRLGAAARHFVLTEAPALLAALAERLGCGDDFPAALAQLHIEGLCFVTPSHVDFVLPLSRANLAVRRAGLDRNLGWRPELGRVISLHFESLP